MALTALIRGGGVMHSLAMARLSSIGRAMDLRSAAVICIATALPRFEKMRKGEEKRRKAMI